MGHRVLVIGRSPAADIRLRDPSVSRQHAELVIGSDGRMLVSDRSSANGTWIEADGRWERCTQRGVVRADRLRLGDAKMTVAELLARAQAAGGGAARERPGVFDGSEDGRHAGSGPGPDDGLPGGPVRRNPETGEIIADQPAVPLPAGGRAGAERR